jgi:hypothetical protein
MAGRSQIPFDCAASEECKRQPSFSKTGIPGKTSTAALEIVL